MNSFSTHKFISRTNQRRETGNGRTESKEKTNRNISQFVGEVACFAIFWDPDGKCFGCFENYFSHTSGKFWKVAVGYPSQPYRLNTNKGATERITLTTLESIYTESW